MSSAAPRAASGATVTAVVELGELGLDRGAHLLLDRALRALPRDDGARLEVRGRAPGLLAQLRAWSRNAGHALEALAPDGDAPASATTASPRVARIVPAPRALAGGRFHDGERAGAPDPSEPGAVHPHPPARWGLAARGALVEAGAPEFDFALATRDVLWADEAARLYAMAAAAQWDPATAIAWSAEPASPVPAEVEDAVVQVMTYLIENETAALVVPARFLARMHPHFREVMQLLAVQAADEARHIEVFTRRALLRRRALGTSSAGGQASLKTLVAEPDFALASFLLSTLGEGSFLDLLWFLHTNAPDPVTADIARLAAQDEARHVAFSLAHLARHLARDPALRGGLAAAVERRNSALAHTAGLNAEVFDALVVLAAGSFAPEAIARGHDAVVSLQGAMDEGRQIRLKRLGFSPGESAALSALHTRNFM